ncbi:restriction endonuclease subunit S [Escherichia coli]|uniref:restriction endonuclease subunit S n=1 Tax=Escherichia coli TaxID=562 RepID=UPI0010B3CA61|nr:restriction endonuclease subunit S [Escherichia coli]EEY3942336.1 restriction endonuclease subunit S [Escherichia coli]EEY4027356.1 restriction endonuclease subunit S [Escherichia coli]EIP9477250.1 restriction endonuclease subunit S [Escherichia coli]GCI91626.1 type I restriction-modification system specificity subunit [Escherichia coli]HEJ0946549.1 restriction endonuclease subunit S [Escherichia coli]
MSRWRNFCITELADFCNAQRIPLSAMERAHKKGNFPYYGASGIVDYIDDYIFDGSYILISEDGENLKSRKTPIAFEATGKFWVNNHAHVLKAKKPHLTALIIQYFSQLDLSPYLTGAAQPKLNKASLNLIPLYLPIDESEQKAIASVLSSLDDKIDLLHRQNKTLESMANTLFRQWFIEDAHIHWTEKKLSSFGRIICGKTPSKKNSLYFGNDVPFLKIPDMHGKVFVFKSTDNLSFAGEHSQSKKTIPPGSICVSCIATVGLVCITDVSMQTNQQINSIIPNKEYYKYFLYLLMKSMGDELNNLASGGTATLNLNTGDFSNITFLSPSENELKIFHQSISSLFDKLKLNSKQINIIENLRDTLLPKLMSGEVRVQYAEEVISSVI